MSRRAWRDMLSRPQFALVVALTCLLLLLLVTGRATPKSSRDEGGDGDEPAFRQRLVAVGDLHGDLDNAQKVLRMAGVIDTSANWIAGQDILVQTGDIVDRETYGFDIYRMMQRLRGEADGAGGRVVSILGNHEMMNAIGDWRYVTDDDIKHTGGSAARQQAMSADGWLGQEWLANYTSTALVALGPHPSSPTLSFTHGSLSPSYAGLTPYPDRINTVGHSLLTKALTPPLAPPYPPNPYSGLPKSATAEEVDIYADGGPFWWRGLAEGDEATVCGWADELTSRLGARRIIGGHTPNFEKIVDRCNASVIIIDTGISSAYGGVLSALEIVYTLEALTPSRPPDQHRQDPLVRADTGGLRPGPYKETEVVTAIYETGRTPIITDEREVWL